MIITLDFNQQEAYVFLNGLKQSMINAYEFCCTDWVRHSSIIDAEIVSFEQSQNLAMKLLTIIPIDTYTDIERVGAFIVGDSVKRMLSEMKKLAAEQYAKGE